MPNRQRSRRHTSGTFEGKRTVPGNRVQVPLNHLESEVVRRASQYYGVTHAEILKAAYRVYWWACEQVSLGYDVGAYDRKTNRFVAVDIPYALEIKSRERVKGVNHDSDNDGEAGFHRRSNSTSSDRPAGHDDRNRLQNNSKRRVD